MLVLTRLIFLLFFSGRIIISSAFLIFSSITCFGFTILSAILLPINSPATSAALWTTFLRAVFRASSPVSYYCFQYFLANDKNPYPLTYFLVLGSLVYCVISDGLPFWSINVMIILSNSVLQVFKDNKLSGLMFNKYA